MSDDSVTVRFGAETSGVTAGGGEVKGVLAGIQEAVAALGNAFKAMGSAAVAGFAEMTAGAEEASTQLKEMRDVGMEVRESMRGLGEVILAGFAVEAIKNAAEQMGQAAEQTQHVADTFGLTTAQVQALRAEASGLGVPFDALTTAMQREDGALTRAREGSKQTGEAFKILGVNIKAPVDNATLLQETIAGLANVADIPTRIGLAMQLFGRNIQNIGPLINVTKAQIAEVSDATAKYGAVNSDAQAKGMQLANAFNMQKIEMQGLGLTLASELAPELTKLVTDITGLLESFRQWASQGDNLKTALTAITVAATAMVSILGAGALTAAVEGLAALLGGVFLGAIQLATAGMVQFDVAADANPIGALVLVVEALAAAIIFLPPQYQKLYDSNAAFRDIVDAVVSGVRGMTDELVQTGKVLVDTAALVLDFARAVQDLNTLNLADLRAAVTDMRQRWVDADDAQRKFTADSTGVTAALDAQTTKIRDQAIALGQLIGQWAALAGVADRVGAAVGAMGGFAKGGGLLDLVNGKGGKGGTDAVQAAMSAFTDQWQHMADMAVAITGNANLNLTQAEVDFWSKKLATAKQGSDLWYAIIEKLNPMVVGLQKAQADEILKIVEDQIMQEEALQKEHTAAYKTELDAEVKAVIDAVNEEVLAHKQGVEKMKEAERGFRSAVDPMVSSFTSGLLKMAEGTQTLQQTMRNLGLQILDDFVSKVIDPMVEKWAWSQTEKVLASTQGQALLQALGLKQLAIDIANDVRGVASTVQAVAAKNVASAAGVATATATATAQKVVNATTAFSGGVASMAAAPFPLDLGAPAFGAQMAALASAAGGFDIGNFAPLTQLHPHEMVLPAHIANPVRAMAESYGAGAGGGAGGDAHLHYNPTINAPQHQSLKQMLTDQGSDMISFVQAAIRNRSLKFA